MISTQPQRENKYTSHHTHSSHLQRLYVLKGRSFAVPFPFIFDPLSMVSLEVVGCMLIEVEMNDELFYESSWMQKDSRLLVESRVIPQNCLRRCVCLPEDGKPSASGGISPESNCCLVFGGVFRRLGLLNPRTVANRHSPLLGTLTCAMCGSGDHTATIHRQ